VALVVLRAPGIYAADRLPLERLRAGTPALRAEDDVYTNHIHAEDLAAIAVRALEDSAPAGVYNASDDSAIRMGEWLDLVAERAGLPRPPRIARAEAAARIPPELLSFMSESRRLVNRRMKEALGIRLQYPTVHDGVPRMVRAA
jgi:nucleoside-diphosphate-sugar epimerase